MSDDTPPGFNRTAEVLSRNPLGIIALFIVLVYGFASLVIVAGTGMAPGERAPLVWFLVAFPVLVFAGFLWLVTAHSWKLYAPSELKDAKDYLRLVTTATSLGAAVGARGGRDASPEDIEDVVKATQEARGVLARGRFPPRLLWVDDQPGNNRLERQAFEGAGLIVDTATSTQEALRLLDSRPYVAVISDMARAEGSQEGFALLDALKEGHSRLPLFLYTGHTSEAHRREAIARGAFGQTSHPQELVTMVIHAIIRRSADG